MRYWMRSAIWTMPRPWRHLAVFAHDLADHAGRGAAGHARQIHRALGVTGAHQDTPAFRPQREDVTGGDEIVGLGLRRDGDADGVRALACRDAGTDAVSGVDAHRERRTVRRAVVMRHHRQAQGLDAPLGQGQADEAAPLAGHEIDGLGRRQIRGHGQVALVLTILVVDHDDQLAGADVGDGLGDGDAGTSLHGSQFSGR
jgi:hypothetical protein